MIINGVNDRKCTEKLIEIPAAQLTLEKVIQTWRQVELTAAHIDTLESPKVIMQKLAIKALIRIVTNVRNIMHHVLVRHITNIVMYAA